MGHPAKHIATRVCGAEEVTSYIEEHINQPLNPDDSNDWVRDLIATSEFDLDSETRQLLRRLSPFRNQIENKLRQFAADDPAVRKVDLSQLWG